MHNNEKAMSRRPPNPAAERAAKNQATIKSLLKLEPNKMCSDCKRNKRMSPNIIEEVILEAPFLLTIFVHRSTMGKLESRRLHLHPLLWHSP